MKDWSTFKRKYCAANYEFSNGSDEDGKYIDFLTCQYSNAEYICEYQTQYEPNEESVAVAAKKESSGDIWLVLVVICIIMIFVGGLCLFVVLKIKASKTQRVIQLETIKQEVE